MKLTVGILIVSFGLQSLHADENTQPEKKEVVTGRIWMRSYDFKEAEKKMEYGLYVPRDYDANKSYPLMVALHGLYSNPRQILGYPGFTKLAQEHGYILAAPMGYNTKGWYGGRGQTSRRWNPENLGELSEKDVMNVLKIVRAEFNVDSKRIYLMGHSMGGGGTWHIGIKYPDIWAGLARNPRKREISALKLTWTGSGLSRAALIALPMLRDNKSPLRLEIMQ